MDIKAAAEKYKKCQEDFISMRTKEEVMLNTFFERIRSIKEPIFEGKVAIPENANLKTLVPEYYVEHPNQEVLEAQIDAVNEMLNKINEILVLKCEEAEKCYSEYQVLASEKR